MDTATPQTVAQAIEAAAQRQQQQQSTPQTVAQAIEAATQQQQEQQAHMSQASPSPPATSHVSSSGIDNLVCQWQGCGERCDNAEALYDHVCERHVGRKSTNNLNLTCAWGACRTTTVKRDHITSHIRVHVPLKPHKCDFCGKSFKRPQDLKKHVKTHADDSVLANSPQTAHRVNNGNGPTSKNDASSLNIAEAIQAYMSNPRGNSFYSGNDNSMNNQFTNYQSGVTTGHDGGYAGSHAQYAGYGNVSYPSNPAMAHAQSMDTRQRAIEALNDFLGDIKRKALNPNNYYDVGQRLQANALPLPVPSGSGYNMGYSGGNTAANNSASYSNTFSNPTLMELFGQPGNNGGGLQGPIGQTGYSLPVQNARTKTDLQEIDRFLEQLQATVYESSSAAAAAGVQQPGVHAQYAGGDFAFGNGNQNNYRTSHSPTTHQPGSGFGSMSSTSGLSVSQPLDTPALTPASVSSYSSGHSPLSSASRPSLGNNGMYPSLPSVTGISDMGSGYPATTSAPASGLATSFDEIDGRRYSGGRLQRQAPPASTTSADVEMEDEQADGAKTPRQEDVKVEKPAADRDDDLPDATDDKSASDSVAVTSPSEAEDKHDEEWVENIRVIEALRKWISGRLKNGEYEEHKEDEEAASDDMHVDRKDSDMDDAKAVETAKAVEEQMAEVLSHANAEHDNKIKQEREGAIEYPTLPSAEA